MRPEGPGAGLRVLAEALEGHVLSQVEGPAGLHIVPFKYLRDDRILGNLIFELIMALFLLFIGKEANERHT